MYCKVLLCTQHTQVILLHGKDVKIMLDKTNKKKTAKQTKKSAKAEQNEKELKM